MMMIALPMIRIERRHKKQGPPTEKEAGPRIGAVGRNRTGDLLITNQLLYQLSYNSILKGGELYLLAPAHGNALATALPWISATD